MSGISIVSQSPWNTLSLRADGIPIAAQEFVRNLFKLPQFSNQDHVMIQGTVERLDISALAEQNLQLVEQLPSGCICSTEMKIKSVSFGHHVLKPRIDDPYLRLQANLSSSLFLHKHEEWISFDENRVAFSKNVRFYSNIDGKKAEFELKLPEKRVYELTQDSSSANAITFETGMRILKWKTTSLDNHPTFVQKLHAANLKTLSSKIKTGFLTTLKTEEQKRDGHFPHFFSQAISSSPCAHQITFNKISELPPVLEKTEYASEACEYDDEKEIYTGKFYIHGATFAITYDQDHLYISSKERTPVFGDQFVKMPLPHLHKKIGNESQMSISYDFGVLAVKFSIKPGHADEPEQIQTVPTTTVAVHFNAGFGNAPHICGNFLGWNEGIRMDWSGDRLWVWESTQILPENAEFKIRFNNEKWELHANRPLNNGDRIELTPKFN